MRCDGWGQGITLITSIQNCWSILSPMFCFLCLLTQSRSLHCALFAWSQGIPRWLTYCGITLRPSEAQRVQPLEGCPHWPLCFTQSWTSISGSATSAIVAWDPVWHQITFRNLFSPPCKPSLALSYSSLGLESPYLSFLCHTGCSQWCTASQAPPSALIGSGPLLHSGGSGSMPYLPEPMLCAAGLFIFQPLLWTHSRTAGAAADGLRFSCCLAVLCLVG